MSNNYCYNISMLSGYCTLSSSSGYKDGLLTPSEAFLNFVGGMKAKLFNKALIVCSLCRILVC